MPLFHLIPSFEYRNCLDFITRTCINYLDFVQINRFAYF